MNCKQCNKEFIAKRKTAQFCSPKCRVAFNRVSVTDTPRVSVTENDKVSVPTLSVESMSDKDRIGKKIEGYCHGCGRDIAGIKEQWVNGKGNKDEAKSICICLPCVRRGITHKGLGLKMC